MTGENRAPVTVIGLGMMGVALAGAFLNAGHPTTVWNRTPGKGDALVEKGAVRAGSVADAVAASDLVVVCVVDYESMHAILDPVGDALAGKVIVNLTSGIPEDAREAAEWTRGIGADYLDGYIMTVPPAVGLPETLLFYGGSQETFEAHQETLKVLGGNSVYLGADAGIASLYDFALLGILWSTLTSALHAFALVGTEKVPASALLPFAEAWITHVIVPTIQGSAQQIDAGEFGTDISTVGLNAMGLVKMIKVSEAQGIRPDLMVPIKDFLAKRVADGHDADALASLIEVIRNPE
ncbi:NAD(P)-dependent oxidoreductase [Streptomyces sp. NPDC051217]|uniref:NAD(P)-dependent oxidoreductase n=1 Tax=Streptomyces sp. NPDC051217 TaxID=3365644 RepID=UPI0037B40914